MILQPLSVVWNFDPVLFSIGSLDIRYYGLMWALAILIVAKFFDNFVNREGLPAKVSESIFIYGTLATILGARLGHCLFYDTMEYLSKPWTIITGFRDGGMASHGAAIGLLIGLWLFSRRNKLPYIWSLDRIMIPVGIGGAIVRLGNLFNSEIFGQATTLPWGFEFVRSHKWVAEFAPAAVHPTLPGDFRHPLLALLQEGHRAPPSGHSVRNRPDRYVPHALFHRVHQNRAGAFRRGLGFIHGSVAQHSLHPAGNLYDLAGRDPERFRAGSGAESPGRNA